MKKEQGVLIAGIFGFAVVIGFIALKKFLNGSEYEDYYDDFHRHFIQDDQDENHGIEFLAMQ